MRYLFGFLILAGMALAAPDQKIVPGQRVGPVTREVRRADLERFAPMDGETEMEGGSVPTTELWGMQPARRLTVVWTDSRRRQARQVLISSKPWRTAEGIGVGTSLAELVRLNGKPIQYWDFGYGENGGMIHRWNGGRLENRMRGVLVQLSWKTSGYKRLSGTEKERLERGDLLSSSSPLSQKLNPVVEFLTVNLR